MATREIVVPGQDRQFENKRSRRGKRDKGRSGRRDSKNTNTILSLALSVGNHSLSNEKDCGLLVSEK